MMRTSPRIRRRSESGYNLVEVLIAMAILATVLISIAGLFLMGRRNVYSGKQMTRAVAVGTQMMEDMAALTAGDIENAFGLDSATSGAPADVDIVFNGNTVDTIPSSYGRFGLTSGGDQGDATKDNNGYLQRWYDLADANLANGEVHIVFTPVEADGDPAASYEVAPIIQLTYYVSWTEQTRQRSITLNSVKVDRTK